jgi:flagellar FliL protein
MQSAADRDRHAMTDAPKGFLPYTAEEQDPNMSTETVVEKKAGKSRLLIMALGALIVLGGGGVAAFYVMRAPAQPGHAAAAVVKPSEPGLLSLEPFTVNLADAGGTRFLRLSVRLVVDSPAAAERAQKNDVLLVRVRSGILELLAQQKADSLVTPEGKTALKAAIAEHAQKAMEDTKVIDVLFSDFVVQF